MKIWRFPISAGFLALLVLLCLPVCSIAQTSPAFVQIAAGAASPSTSSLALAFSANTAVGNLILVGVDHDSNATVSSVSDSQGNVFTAIGAQLTTPGGARSRVYYANSIKGGADTVTVNLSASSSFI